MRVRGESHKIIIKGAELRLFLDREIIQYRFCTLNSVLPLIGYEGSFGLIPLRYRSRTCCPSSCSTPSQTPQIDINFGMQMMDGNLAHVRRRRRVTIFIHAARVRSEHKSPSSSLIFLNAERAQGIPRLPLHLYLVQNVGDCSTSPAYSI